MAMASPKPDGADASSMPEGKGKLDPVPGNTQGAKTENDGNTDRSNPPDEELVNPPSDFKGEVDTNNEIPSPQVLKAIENYTVFDHAGKTHPFKSLYSGHNVARRILVIFVRHFFCGNCQEYLRTLSTSITPEALLALPVSTFIVVVGCGAHELIDTYVKETGCAFPVYADPTRRLYQELGMARTFSMGPRPAYLQDKTVAHTVVSGIVQGLRQVKTGLVTKMGDQRQVGGEFLFEPASGLLETPISSPAPIAGDNDNTNADAGAGANAPPVEEKCVTWCHRMRTTRDHAEIPELMEILGLHGAGEPSRDAKRWQKALTARKGTGLSMAGQMGRMSLDTAKTNAAPEAGV
ncbi:AhpC/TSA antioxidant enzyme-domain-containing protein [Xylaria sp. FL1777]|nr:AhpC/TSA antioxidant enzyme-domain-containing protein [Xylaria sp. FL1777]